MTRIHLFRCLAVLLVGAGCDTRPFEIISPETEERVGSVLISTSVPAFTRGLIQRVEVEVTSADTSRLRTINRSLNFPNPGGNFSVGQIADIPIGKRRFTVRAFDTTDTLRFRGATDSLVVLNQTKSIQVQLSPIGGAVDFRMTIDPSNLDETVIDSAGVARLASTSILDVLEVVNNPFHPGLGLLPILSMGMDRFSVDSGGRFTRLVSVRQIPMGERRFVAHLKDLSSGGTLAFADTLTVFIDTLATSRSEFLMELVSDPATLSEIFTKDTLPPDSSVVVVTPQF